MCSKAMPKHVNPFLNITIVYIIAFFVSLIFFLLSSNNSGIIENIKLVNYAVMILAISLVGLEMGFLMLYRVGWNISIGALVNGIMASTMLAILGVLVFNENLGINRIIGLSLCFFGLYLLSKPNKSRNN